MTEADGIDSADPSAAGGDVLTAVRAALTERLRVAPVAASMTFIGVEPIQVLRFAEPEAATSYVSLGMSRAPMSAIGPDGAERIGPRAELVVQLRGRPDEVWRRLAVLAAAPTVESAVFRAGMTVDLGEPWTARSRCVGAVVETWASLESVATSAGSVELLRLLPATATELAWSRVRGTAALLERWTDHAVDLLDIERTAVEL